MDEDGAASGSNGWSGLGAIAALNGLNTRCFAALAEAVRGERAVGERSSISRELRLWGRVDQRACERAGSCPVLLLNLNFDRVEWWKGVSRGAVGLTCTAGPSPLFAEACGSPLLREILTEVRQLSRSTLRAANLLFGLAPGVGAQIADLSVPEIERIANDHLRSLRPRWEASAVFWKNLLEAATGTDDEALAIVHLHCLQLLGNDLEVHYN